MCGPTSESTIKVGFLGCGTIAAAIATGLATQNKVKVASIAVSHRSASKSKALQESFPDLVSIHEDNQEIVDQSDIVFLCVLPKYASQVLQDLQFDNTKHSLVSIVVRNNKNVACDMHYFDHSFTHNHSLIIYF
jgi:pyrroline-5-carboxylate reductase